MIQILYGKRGLGKTKRMIELANAALSQVKGDIVFIDDDNRCMLDLNHSIRYINAGEYQVTTPDLFVGFVCGILATDYDVEQVYLDGFPQLVGLTGPADMKDMFARLEAIAAKANANFVLSVSGTAEELPDFLKPYVMD